jgi:hypothetical protein
MVDTRLQAGLDISATVLSQPLRWSQILFYFLFTVHKFSAKIQISQAKCQTSTHVKDCFVPTSVPDPDPHLFVSLDPDPHLFVSQDPDPDTHCGKKLDPDPRIETLVSTNRMLHFLKALLNGSESD